MKHVKTRPLPRYCTELFLKFSERIYPYLNSLVVSAILIFALYIVLRIYGEGRIPMPADYSARDLRSGQTVFLNKYRGSVIVIMGWASWCMDCQEELAGLERLWVSQRDRGLMVLCVNLDKAESDQRIDSLMSQYSLSYPVWRDPENEFASIFYAPAIPTTVLMDKNNKVIRSWVGPVDFDSDDFISEIEAALSQ